MKSSLHAPVGLIGFIVTCLATYWMFSAVCTKEIAHINSAPRIHSKKSFVIICFFIFISIIANQFSLSSVVLEASQLNNEKSSDEIALTDNEKNLFLRHGVISYEKKRFLTSGLTGTAFLVLAKSWRGHHHPEQCLQGQGAVIDSTRTLVIQNGLQVRSLEIKDSKTEVVYWFQSLDDSTDDYSSRVWSGFIHPTKPYVMISLYLDNGKQAESSAYKNVINDFHQQAMAMLREGTKYEIQNQN